MSLYIRFLVTDERAINDIQASCTAESDEVEASENNDVSYIIHVV